MKTLNEYIYENLDTEILTEGRIADLAIDLSVMGTSYLTAAVNDLALGLGGYYGVYLPLLEPSKPYGTAGAIASLILSIAFQAALLKGGIDTILLSTGGNEKDSGISGYLKLCVQESIKQFMKDKKFNNLCKDIEKYPELIEWLQSKKHTKKELDSILNEIEIDTKDKEIIKELVNKFWDEFKYQVTSVSDVKQKSNSTWTTIKKSVEDFFKRLF